MNCRAKWIVALLLLAVTASMCFAQFRRGGGRRWRDYGGEVRSTEGGPGGGSVIVDPDVVRTAREVASHSSGTPEWTNPPAFPRDAFTFVRVVWSDNPSAYFDGGSWITDFPDSDLNLSFRLQQMTSIKVDPNGRILRLTDPDLANYPWIYMVEPSRLGLKDEEVTILRNYLLNGGFLMADDFWGEIQWNGFHEQMKRVFPDRDFVDVPINHPIFHCVFDIKGPIENLQVPAKGWGRYGRADITWEYHNGEECRPTHVRAIFDDKGRIMVIATHNTDNGDGWEREGEDDSYFHRFSENISFPLGINIIFYAMTH